MKNNYFFYILIILVACQLSSCQFFNGSYEAEKMLQQMKDDSLFVQKETEESLQKEMESNNLDEVQDSPDDPSLNNFEDTTMIDYEDTVINSIENSIKNELECIKLRVSKVKPSELMTKEFMTKVNNNSEEKPICEDGEVYEIFNSGNVIGYKIVKENYSSKNKNLYIFDLNGLLYVLHLTEYIKGDVFTYHFNYTGLVVYMEVKNKYNDYRASFKVGVTKEQAFLDYKNKDKIKVSTSQGNGTYLTDGQKCSNCGLGRYQSGFCGSCNAASGERVNESYSKAAKCDFCRGSGFIDKGGIHGGRKVCPSCKGKGKQIY